MHQAIKLRLAGGRSMKIFFVYLFAIMGLTDLAAAAVGVDLAKSYNAAKLDLQKDESKQRQVMSALYKINKNMKKMVSERGQLSQEKFAVENSVQNLEEKIGELEASLKEQRLLLRERTRVIYKLGGQGIARLLFSSRSSLELERNLRVLGAISKKDAEIIKLYYRNLAELEKKKSKLVNRLTYLTKVEKRIESKEKELTAENQMKEKILARIKSSQKFNLQKIEQIRAQSSEAKNSDAGVFDLFFRPAFFEKKGQLSAPISGPLLARYGIQKVAGERSVKLPSRGIFIGAQLSSAVKSVFEGSVAFAGEVPGHGKTVVIDHGDHYYSVYGHLSSIEVQEGQELRSLQSLGRSGFDSLENRSGLYFEIRHFSEPYDPSIWVKGIQQDETSS
jgi:murein hydrolase activator